MNTIVNFRSTIDDHIVLAAERSGDVGGVHSKCAADTSEDV